MSSQYNVSIRHNVQTPYYRAERYSEVLLYNTRTPASPTPNTVSKRGLKSGLKAIKKKAIKEIFKGLMEDAKAIDK